MKKQKSNSLYSGLIMFFMTACAGFSAHADDTEIFFGGTTSTHKSNVLFILDTSGSMSDEDCTGSFFSRVCQPTRMERMKSAFQSLLAEMNNVNVGLMRYNSPGGPILYPVTDIDSPLDSGSIATARISASENDAEESAIGDVTLDNPTLALTTRVSSGGGTVSASVSSGFDDTEEKVTTNTISVIGSAGLEIPYDNYSPSDANEHRVGVIFRGINIPKDAIILESHITFRVQVNNGSSDFDEAVKLDIHGQAPGVIDDFNTANINSRTTTTAFRTWDVPASPDVGETLDTPALNNIISEITSDATWTSGSDMAFFLERNPLDGKEGLREFSSADSGNAPTLTVVYEESATPTSQTVGLRFTELKIPQGARIKSASLQFNSAATDNTPAPAANMTIYGEYTGNAQPFTTTAGDISSRTTTSSAVSWSPSGWTIGDTHSTTDNGADLKDIVQEIVSHSDWCGGQNMAFILEGTGTRFARAYDDDPSSSPLLKIEYDPTDIISGNGCTLADLSYRVSADEDDAEQETTGSKDLKTNSDELWLQHYYAYDDVCVRSIFFGLICVETEVQLVEDYDHAIGVRFTNIEVPKNTEIVNAYLEFAASNSDSDAMSNLSIQIQSTDSANSYRDQSGRRVLDRTYYSDTVTWSGIPSWTQNAVYQTPNLSTLVQQVVNRTGWAEGNSMAFKIQGSGSAIRRAFSYNGSPTKAPRLVLKLKGTSDTVSGVTTRDAISALVEEFQPSGATPIVDVLYEAALYFRGDNAYWGRIRGDSSASSTSRKYYRLSHPNSYTNGSVYRPAGCTESNLNDSDCINSVINGSPEYISPIDDVCATNHIVLLSDGEPTVNESVSEIQAMIGKTCSQSGDEQCANDLAYFLQNSDQSSLSGDQGINVHTIAFNSTASVNFLSGIASNGGGYAKSASTTDELLQVFKEILTEVNPNDTTFVSPGVTVNTFNRLTHLNELYFALFKPESTPSWPGNLKRYQVKSDGTIQDNSNPKIDAIDPNSGFFKDNAKSWWSNSVDGSDTLKGGAASQLPSYDSRNMYTYYAGSPSLNLANAVNSYSKDNSAITKDMLSIATESDDYRDNLMDWFRGKDVLDADGDGITAEDRDRMGDPLHSVPKLVTYGGTSDNPDLIIFFGDNEGLLHAIDTETGEEIFSFIPEELLDNANTVFANSRVYPHPYGLDGAISSWIKDVDGDNQIEAGDGDHVYIYVGMRRGGRNYYALDVTDLDNPKMLWTIRGGEGDYTELGQTWSRPAKTKVKINNTVHEVLVFTGGYDPDQDNYSVTTVDNQGRAIYIVDAETGQLLWEAGPSSADLNLSDMQYSIPGNIRTIDVNSDGLIDQMYAADVGGQVWRFDIFNGESASNLVTGGAIADISGTTQASARRFYHGPDVSVFSDDGYTTLAITVGSGYHAHPLNDAIDDRIYMIRQSDVFNPPAPGASGTSPKYDKLTESDLYDATRNYIQSSDSTTAANAAEALASADGWYIKLEAGAEKMLSTAINVNGVLFFTTYSPEIIPTSSCAVRNGTARIYRVNVADGGALKDADGDYYDRSELLKNAGIPPNPVRLRISDDEGTRDQIFVGTEKTSLSFEPPITNLYWHSDQGE